MTLNNMSKSRPSKNFWEVNWAKTSIGAICHNMEKTNSMKNECIVWSEKKNYFLPYSTHIELFFEVWVVQTDMG